MDVQRRISIRVALSEGNHPYRFAERLRPYFNEGVALARRLPDDPARLARALTDRAMFLVAARTFDAAYADYAEAVALLDARWSPSRAARPRHHCRRIRGPRTPQRTARHPGPAPQRGCCRHVPESPARPPPLSACLQFRRGQLSRTPRRVQSGILRMGRRAEVLGADEQGRQLAVPALEVVSPLLAHTVGQRRDGKSPLPLRQHPVKPHRPPWTPLLENSIRTDSV